MMAGPTHVCGLIASRDQVQAGGTVALVLERTVARFAEPVAEHLGQGVLVGADPRWYSPAGWMDHSVDPSAEHPGGPGWWSIMAPPARSSLPRGTADATDQH